MSDTGQSSGNPNEQGQPPVPPVPPLPAPAAAPSGVEPPAAQPGGFDPAAYPPPAGPASAPGYAPGFPPQQGYPQQPGYPQGFQPAQPGGPQPPKKGLGIGAILGIVGGGVVLLIIIVALIVFALRPGAGSGNPAAGGGEPGSTPTGVVTAYLEALAAGDAETALQYAGDQHSDDSLLTDEMLAASLAVAPIEDIEVTDTVPDGISADVPASFTMGDETVTGTWSVHDYDQDGTWELTTGVAELMLGGNLEGLELTLNGEDIGSPSTITVFPGVYEVATTTPDFVLGGATALVIGDPFNEPRWNDITVTLTDDGLATFRQLVQDAVATCMTSTNLEAGCGLDLPPTLSDGTAIVEGSITRSLSAEAQSKLESLEPQESYGDPLLVRGDFIGGIEVRAQFGDGTTGTILFGPSLGSPLVDFTTGDPVVRWDG